MPDTKPPIAELIEHQQGIYTGTGSAYEFAKLQSLRELAAIKSQPVPVEPELVRIWRKAYGPDNEFVVYIDTLQAALQRAQQERDKCAQMNDDQSRRVYAAEEKVRRMVELLKECGE